MFSISTTKTKFYPPINKEIIDIKHKYDLINGNYYDEDGNILQKATEGDNKREFILLLERYDLEIHDILGYHFLRSNNQHKLINFFKNLIHFESIDISIRENIKEWLNKNNDHSETQKMPNESIDIIIDSNKSIDSKIDEYLKKFNQKTQIDDENYSILKAALKFYFEYDFFQNHIGEIKVINTNIKSFGHSLKSLFRDLRSRQKLDVKYLKFAKNHISIYRDTQFDENKYIQSTLYKYFTSKKN